MVKSIKRIVLNWLPPADQNSPSFCLSVLKSHMARYGFEVKIIYWNLLFNEISEVGKEIPYAAVFPFLIEMNCRTGTSQSRVKAILQSANPTKYTDTKSFYSLVEKTHEDLNGIINSVLRPYINQEVLLWGFSSKYYQWIPAAIIAESIKKLLPGAYVVLGGMGTYRETKALLSLFKAIDFGVWGEGEFPLYKICDQLLRDHCDFNSIPNIVFNQKGVIQPTHFHPSQFEDLNQTPIPNYEDYFDQIKDFTLTTNMYLPIESSRGCHWNRCKFCFLNDGYKYRVKNCKRLLDEIDKLKTRYGINNFSFVDPDLVGSDTNRFGSMVKMLLDYNKKHQWSLSFNLAEINPGLVNVETIKMMFQAGLKNIQIGLEAISDNLLKKMNKKTTVAKNLYFIKHALRNRLSIQGANIIPHIPDETPDDIVESIENLHYLRFFLDKEQFTLPYSPFALKSSSLYFKHLSEERKKLWCNNLLYDAFPHSATIESKKYDLFDFIGDKNKDWWMLFEKRLTYYLENSFSYIIKYEDNCCLFQEYFNDQMKKSLKLSFIVTDMLKLLDQRVCSLADICDYFETYNTGVLEQNIKEIISELKTHYLVYTNDRLSEITSIISL